MFDVQKVRADFPILKTGVIYLDNAATSLTPEPVLQKMLEFYRQYRANVKRGVHRLSQRASDEYERVYQKISDFINAKSKFEIILTQNATEGINLIANGLKWKKENKIVTSILEHHSNFIVWQKIRDLYGVSVEIMKPQEPVTHGLLDTADFEDTIDDKTKLVAITHISNVLGTVTPLKEIVEIAHEHGAYVLVDGAQSVPHISVDVQKLDCDFLAFSGHKMCGPTGSSALYIREELIEKIEPTKIGGGSIEDVKTDTFILKKGSARFESGTPAIAESIGLGAAIDYLRKIGMNNIEKHEKELTKQLYDGLYEIPKVKIYGPKPDHRIGIIPFNVGDLNSHDVALTLDVSKDIMVRSGHHCALPLTKKIIRSPGSVRASTYLYNTEEEVISLISGVREIAKALDKR